MRGENLRHLACGVLLRSPAGDVFVHRRSPRKDWMPSAHDAAAGGVLLHGEDPRAAAEREVAEELGVSAVLEPLGVFTYEDETTRCVSATFEAVHDPDVDGPLRFADGEVVWGAWWSLERLDDHLADPTWPFVPDTRSVLTRLARAGVGDYARLTGLLR